MPEPPPPTVIRTLEFRPSVNGFAFPNALSGPDVTVTVPLAGRLSIGDASNGVCGGMVFAACDYFEAAQPIPAGSVPPASGSPLYTVITSRLIDSFNIPAGIAQYLVWMAAPDRSTGLLWWRRRGIGEMTVADHLPTIRAALDAGHPCPLGLVTVSGIDPRNLGANHVVLAYGYRLDDSGELTLRVYDPKLTGSRRHRAVDEHLHPRRRCVDPAQPRHRAPGPWVLRRHLQRQGARNGLTAAPDRP